MCPAAQMRMRPRLRESLFDAACVPIERAEGGKAWGKGLFEVPFFFFASTENVLYNGNSLQIMT